MTPRTPITAQPATRPRRDTAQQILDVAEHLLQVRGFNAFSYADVAAELGVTKASLHYHFPGKAELGRALIVRYTQRFVQALEQINREQDLASSKLIAYADLYAGPVHGHRMCLCGMLAAEYQTLPETIRDAVVIFFDDNEVWLEQVLEQGRIDQTLHFEGTPRDTARMIISGLEGAMLVARPYGDVRRFQNAAATLLANLTASR